MTVLPEARGLSRAWRWGIGSALALTLAMVWRPLYRLIWHRLHGYTGDCCGAIFLLTELVIYLIATYCFSISFIG